MCCRYLIFRAQLKELLRQVGARGAAEWADRFNVAPGTGIAVVRAGDDGSEPECVEMTWGLRRLAASPGERGGLLVNVRSEGLAERRRFREALRTRRCLVPVSGFYEWRREGAQRYPWLFRRADEQPFFLAGIWEDGAADSDRGAGCCAVVTTEADAVMKPIHPRMPVIVRPESAALWLQKAAEPGELTAAGAPGEGEKLAAIEVDQRVNSTACDDAACLRPADTRGRPIQGVLDL